MLEEKKFQTPPPNRDTFIKEYRHLNNLLQKRRSGFDAPLPDIRRFEELRQIIGEDAERIDKEFKNSAK